MPLVPRIALLLAASPILMFLGHVAAYRGLSAAGKRPSAHTSAFAGIALSFAAIVVIAAAWTWGELTASALTAASTVVYVIGTYGALSVLYLDLVNIAETSLHMHLLLEVSWNDQLSLARLIDKYSPSHMVGERLERLTAMGQVLRDGDRYRLGANRTALFIARAVDAWRTVLGMPTAP